MSESRWADKRTVLEAVKRNGMDLQHASPELQADEEVVMEAVRRVGRALQFASEELRGDKEVVLAAVQENGSAFEYASVELRSDKAAVMEAVVAEEAGRVFSEENASMLSASDELRADKTFMLEVVKCDGLTLQHGSLELRADKEVVLEAVKQKGEAIRFASQELRADKEILLEVAKQNGQAIYFASEEPCADKEVVLEAVKQNGWAIEYASAELKADKEVVLEAVKQSGRAVEFASNELRADKEEVPHVPKQNPILFASQKLRADKELQVLAARVAGQWGPETISYCCKVELSRTDFRQLVDTALAIRGEEAPIVTVSLDLRGGDTTGSQQNEEVHTGGTFECEASLLSGLTFCCSIPDVPSTDHSGTERFCPTLGVLAAKLVGELGNHSKAPRRVFINFIVNDDGDVVSVTPWDWERPLSDFLPASHRGEASEPLPEGQHRDQ